MDPEQGAQGARGQFENVRSLPASTTFTPEQALGSAAQFEGTRLLLVVAEDAEGNLLVRSSRMTRADAVWLLEKAKHWAMHGREP